MNILFATTEAVPFCKTGGLGDVCGSLPVELAKLGHNLTLVMPAFRQVYESGEPLEATGITFRVQIGSKSVEGEFLKGTLPNSNVPVYFVKNDHYFDRAEPYRQEGEDYKDNCERFVFFARAVLEAVRIFDLKTDILHCHDWMSGLIPAYIKTQYGCMPPYDSIATLFTIHNLAYQGCFWHWDMELTGLDWKYFNWQQMEFYGNLNFLKTALSFADTINTVSPTYAQEIQRPPLSCGLEGMLTYRQADLHGIINGADYSVWSPEIDPYLGGNNFTSDSVGVGKPACKAALQQKMGLPVCAEVPLLAAVGRLADQKGFDLIFEVIEQWARTSDAQWVILGTGEEKYHQMFSSLAAQYPEKVAVRLAFSNELAHQIEAGADMFLMPSQYEPCGLNQLYSLKYGTVPLVRATGGLADTIVNCTDETFANQTANGFSFYDYNAYALADTVKRACERFVDKPAWAQIVKTGMQQDWSWSRSAKAYSDLYTQTLEKITQSV